jgi:hypothetical protein
MVLLRATPAVTQDLGLYVSHWDLNQQRITISLHHRATQATKVISEFSRYFGGVDRMHIHTFLKWSTSEQVSVLESFMQDI